MKIRVRDVTETPEEVEFGQEATELNAILQSGRVRDYHCKDTLRVGVTHYRAGRDLFFDGEIRARIAGCCARCMEDFEFALSTPLHFLMIPRDESGDMSDDEDSEVGLYDGEEVALAPLVYDRVVLSLPTTPLCDENCRGLCPRCGTNLNREQCSCPAETGDPRMAIFRSLRVDR